MKYTSYNPGPINARTFIATLLSYVLITSQLAPLAVAFNGFRIDNPTGDTSVKNQPEPKKADVSNAGKRNHPFAPVPVPLAVAPSMVVPIISATKVDSFADSDGDGKAEPGEIITYSITIQNTGPDPALNLTLNDTVDPVNQNLTLIGGSVRSTPVAFNDTYSVLGNVRIQVPDGASDLLANDKDPENAGNSNAGMTITTLAGDNSAPFSGTSTNGGQVTAASGNGSFEYNPPPGFTGSDTFTYTTTDSTGGGTSAATVTLTVTGLIWFINSAASCPCDGRITNPFVALTGAGSFDAVAADEAGDNTFLYTGNYTGGLTLLANQKVIGQGASATLETIAGVTVPTFSDSLPATGGTSPFVTTAGANALTVSAGGIVLRGFTIGNTAAGAKIFGSAFGTLTVGNNTTPDMILNGTGMALNLTNGTFADTSGFSSVTTTSSAAQGILLMQVAGTVALGSTTVSGSTTQGILVQQSTVDVNFGSTVVGTGVAGTGGTNGVALLNNSAGTRTFGTLTIQNINGPANSAFFSNVGGNSVATTTSIPNVPGTGNGVDIQALATGTSAQFGATTVNKASPGSLVNLLNNIGNVSFLSLGGTNTNGAGLTGNGNSGSITVTNNAGSLTATLGPAVSITKAAAPNTPITLNFTALSSTSSGSNGVSLDRVSGNLTTGTTNVNNSTGTGIQVQNTGAGTIDFGTTVSTLTGNASNDAAGTGVFLTANAANVTFGDLDISPDANERAFHATNNTGTLTTSSGDIAATGNVTLEIVGLSLVSRTPLAMTLNNLDSTNSNGLGVNINFVSGNFTVNDATLATNIQNPTGVGLQVLNTAAGGTMNFGNTGINGSGGIGASLGTAGNGNAGNITFADLDIAPDANLRALVAIDNTGTLTVATGDITTSGSGNRAVEIDGPAGRTPINVQFTNITTSDAVNSISLIDVSGTKFQVTGTTQINTRAGTGVFVDNSTATNIQFATVNVPNVNNAGGYGIRVEDSSSPVTVATATINNPNVVTAQSDGGNDGIPDTDGDGDAIFLTNNTGTFTLNGGTLSNCGNDCIDIRNSAAPALSGVSISTPGIDIPLPVSTGAGFGGHGISAINITGTNTVNNVTISSVNVGNRDGFYLVNTTSTALTLTVQNSTFQNFTGNRGFSIQGNNAANMTATVTSCTFTNISAVALQHIAGGSTGSTATVNMTVENSTFQTSPVNGKTNLLAGVVEAGKANLTIQNNTFNNVFVTASTGEAVIGIGQDGTLAGNSLSLNLSGNTINGVGTANSNCGGGGVTPCLGPIWAVIVFIDDAANVPGTLNIDNNTITNTRQGGINLDMANSGAVASNVAAKITNNCIGRLRVAGACTGAESRIGQGAGLAAGRGISVERRRIGAKTANVLVSGNNVRNGVGQSAGALNTPGIFARTHADTQMSITVINNSIDTDFVGAPEIRLDTNSPTAGDPATQVMCSDINGNSFPNAGPVIDINEIVGTHNVEQASAAAVAAANGAATVTADAGVTFGVACAVPPAGPVTDVASAKPKQKNSSETASQETATAQISAPQQTAPTDSITSRPFISSPRPETAKAPTSTTTAVNSTEPTKEVSFSPSADRPTVPKAKKSPPTTNDVPNPNPPVVVGNNLTWNIGTLPAGQSVTITFQAQVEGPPYTGPAQVSNQGTVTADGGILVLTDDPTVGGGADPTVTPIDIPPDVSISNATVAEPPSSTTSILFTVALSTPATQMITINYSTANGSAVEPGDYVAASNLSTVFQVGEQIKVIPITVNSDPDGAEGDENFTVTITSGQATVVDGTATGTITATNVPGTLLISELRTSGPGGAGDDFVEIYNNTDSPHTVAATGGSSGYGVFKMGANCNATPVLIGAIPNGTVIPARGHFLLVGSAYSLANYGGTGAAAGNLTLTSDIENDRNVSLFSTTDILQLSTTTRFDAVGFGTNTGTLCDLQREGTNLGAVLGSTLEYSFFRKICSINQVDCLTPGRPKETNDNSVDFLFADTAATLVAGAGQRLGAPGPENLASPIKRDPAVSIVILDGSVPAPSPPNRLRDSTVDPNPANNSLFGTMTIRRRIANNTGAPVTRLRFRIIDMTTAPAPTGLPEVADLRARTSVTVTGVMVNDMGTCVATGTPATAPCTVTVQGLTLEQPPTQAGAGGFNSTLSAGTITLATSLAAGASVNVQFLLGVQKTGSFRFFIVVEALP